jgi:hypothetical protein
MEQPSKPSIFHMAVYLSALAVGGKHGWLYGYGIGGTVLAIIFAIVGAVLAATLVGVIAALFGYRP